MMFKYMSTEISNYKQYKEKLDAALTSAADNMVRVGYLLIQARDTDILKESGYSGMGDFAQKEYGLSPDQTSRFMGIAEKFGDGEGRLQAQWQQFGYTKLSEMLTLPDKVAEAIPAEITRDEIREIKAEIKAEEQISPVEAEIEKWETKMQDPDAENTPMIRRFFKEYFREKPEEFLQAISTEWKIPRGSESDDKKAVLNALAPTGIAILEARIPGAGRFMLSFKGEDTLPTFLGIRENTSTELYWLEVRDGFDDLTEGIEDINCPTQEEEIKGIWERLYGKTFPESQEKEPEKKPERVKIAPAQTKKPEKKKETKKDKNTVVIEPDADLPDLSEEPVKVTAAPTACQPAEPVDVWKDDAVNPPEEPKEEAADRQQGEAPIDKDVREAKIGLHVGKVNRLALDLKDYAESMEKLEQNNNHMFVADLLFNFKEFNDNKLLPELEELCRLLKMRWDEEISDAEEAEE